MKYAIVSTWNGEGYSHMNTLRPERYETREDAMKVAHGYALEQNGGDVDVTEYEEEDGVTGYCHDDSEDQGSELVIDMTGVYGLEILCNVNTLIVHRSEEHYLTALEYAKNCADPDESPDLAYDSEPFIGAYTDDYDRQFIRNEKWVRPAIEETEESIVVVEGVRVHSTIPDGYNGQVRVSMIHDHKPTAHIADFSKWTEWMAFQAPILEAAYENHWDIKLVPVRTTDVETTKCGSCGEMTEYTDEFTFCKHCLASF